MLHDDEPSKRVQDANATDTIATDETCRHQQPIDNDPDKFTSHQ